MIKADIDDYTLSEDPSAALTGRCWSEAGSAWGALISSSGVYSYYYICFRSVGMATHTIGTDNSMMLGGKSPHCTWIGSYHWDETCKLLHIDWHDRYTFVRNGRKAKPIGKPRLKVFRVEHYVAGEYGDAKPRWPELLFLTEVQDGTGSDNGDPLVFIPLIIEKDMH